MLLTLFTQIEPPTGLAEIVVTRVRQAEIRALHWRIAASFTGLLASVGTIILSWNGLWAELAGSSFINLIHLAFTDSDVMFANFGSSLNGLLESFPVMPVLLGLMTLFCLIASIGFLQALRRVRHSTALHLA
ncbi:MAG: hypothetical protein WA001_04180 [Patescibacteria group bacterium]